MNSAFLRLNLSDFEKGLILAIIVAVLTYLQQAIGEGGFSGINWQIVINTAVLAGIGYLLKNLSTNSEGKFGRPEPK